MIKKLLLTTSAFFVFQLNAQQYFPMLDSANTWSYTSQMLGLAPPNKLQAANCTYNTGSPFMYAKHYTGGDSTISSKKYKMLYETLMGNAPCLFGFLREDTAAKKVYFLDNQNSAEVLLYDFSMQKGNTMNISFINTFNAYYQSGTYTLDSIKTVKVKAGLRRAFYLNASGNSKPLVWIEGVGNQGHAVYPYSWNYSGQGNWWGASCGTGFPYANYYQVLTCFEHINKVYFDSCMHQLSKNNQYVSSFDSCKYGGNPGGMEELSSLGSFHFAPNPAGSLIRVEMEIKSSDDFTIAVTDVLGRESGVSLKLGRLNPGDKTITLDVSSLAPGMYMLQCKTAQGMLSRKITVQR